MFRIQINRHSVVKNRLKALVCQSCKQTLCNCFDANEPSCGLLVRYRNSIVTGYWITIVHCVGNSKLWTMKRQSVAAITSLQLCRLQNCNSHFVSFVKQTVLRNVFWNCNQCFFFILLFVFNGAAPHTVSCYSVAFAPLKYFFVIGNKNHYVDLQQTSFQVRRWQHYALWM